jgi:general transcription factor 3C polypeptide 3 (transcription factor C subunit 4)
MACNFEFFQYKGLMGEANLRYARGEKKDAMDLCKEVIRQVNSL